MEWRRLVQFSLTSEVIDQVADCLLLDNKALRIAAWIAPNGTA